MAIVNTRLYWRIRSSSLGGIVGRWMKPIAVLMALVRAHDYNYALPSQKRELLLRVAQDFDCGAFVESGTYLGDTTAFMARHGFQCTTIELQPDLVKRAQRRFDVDGSDVRVLAGDSKALLPTVVGALDRPTLFWLDAHFSSGMTAGEGAGPPLSVELALVLNDDRFEHCIAIDDARDLLGMNGYPRVTDVAALVSKSRPGYTVRIVTDIVLITPARM